MEYFNNNNTKVRIKNIYIQKFKLLQHFETAISDLFLYNIEECEKWRTKD